MKNILTKLVKIQNELKAPKNQKNTFGNFRYRSVEDILEGLKPLLSQYGCVIHLTDSIKMVGDRIYVEATASIFDVESGECFASTAYAREEEKKDKMDRSQTTGSASSYARKYALNGLLAIDDTKDADSLEPDKTSQSSQSKQPAISQQPSTTISEAQRKRLFALAKDEAKIREVLATYNIQHTADIPKSLYEEICNKVGGQGGK